MFESIIKFSIKKNIGKMTKYAATTAVSAAAPLLLKYAGVDLTPEQHMAATIAVGSAISGALNYLKVKFPANFGWL